jgi:hypothetical protein
MKTVIIAATTAILAIALNPAAGAQTSSPPETSNKPSTAATSQAKSKGQAPATTSGKSATASDAARPAADTPSAGKVPYDRRVEALKGSPSSASANVDAAAAANQVVIPDYPPKDPAPTPQGQKPTPPR